jgi:hypothetical protein
VSWDGRRNEQEGEMKERNFEMSPLTEDEFAMMLLGVPDELLRIYLSWLREEMNRRGFDEH